MDTLLISDDFFGYAKEIRRALEARGRSVAWFPDRFSTGVAAKASLRIAPWLAYAKTRAHFERVIQAVRGQPIRDVLVIKGESVTVGVIKRLREALPRARFTLYFWDSYRNMPAGSADKVPLFDRAFSFDPQDAVRDPRLSYRPLFYLDDYRTIGDRHPATQDIDVLFFGTVHSDRYSVLTRLEQALPRELVLKKVLYFPSRTLYRMKRTANPSLWRAREEEFIFKPLPKAEIMSLVARAKIVVDIERSIQSGLTMRTVEMLGASKKLITTNPQARTAEFFHPSNVCVIDRFRPRIDPAFIGTPYEPVQRATLDRYSLSGWIDEVLP